MKNNFELEHIGINTANETQALELAEQLSMIFNLIPRHGQKSEFAGDYFECMKAPFLGTNGHIAMRTADLESAVAELEAKGLAFNMDTAAYDEENKLKNIYLAGEFGGFAIHILRK
ncbi:2-dehydro-3-deoxyphosphogluconate aldolase [Enterococcus casseliflavus]|uniref:2-dehydro-3-deoxyphosphogluconate aldolase n=1 Tax=Enterococcus casseliflavus TaxID=37734 RepID=A0A415EQ34_ENTCA|nr:2-dehydro-3-deoxyphosphogluconate aldolase [Enterococcus casseliflavus]